MNDNLIRKTYTKNFVFVFHPLKRGIKHPKICFATKIWMNRTALEQLGPPALTALNYSWAQGHGYRHYISLMVQVQLLWAILTSQTSLKLTVLHTTSVTGYSWRISTMIQCLGFLCCVLPCVNYHKSNAEFLLHIDNVFVFSWKREQIQASSFYISATTLQTVFLTGDSCCASFELSVYLPLLPKLCHANFPKWRVCQSASVKPENQQSLCFFSCSCWWVRRRMEKKQTMLSGNTIWHHNPLHRIAARTANSFLSNSIKHWSFY